MVLGGPTGAVLQQVDVMASVLILVTLILVAILSDVVAVAAAAANDVPFNAMASDKVPGAKEALMIVRNAGRVNSICADIVGDISGTVSGVVATPLILALHANYPHIPTAAIGMVVIGLIAFFTIGGKAAEKEYAVRYSTNVIFVAGLILHYVMKITPSRRRRARQ